MHTDHYSSPREPSRGLSAAQKYPGSVAAWTRQLREMGLWREALQYEHESQEPTSWTTYGPYPSRPEPVDPVRAAGFIRRLDDAGLRQGIQNYSSLLSTLCREECRSVELENCRTALSLMSAERDQRAASQRELVGVAR